MPFVNSRIYTLMIIQIQLVDLTWKEKTVRCWDKVWYYSYYSIIPQNFVTFLREKLRKINKINLIENWRNVRES